ncbi:MAG TPA: DUF2507 domain-containing protein [Pseudogracilibacillus sp.]|nr:DUF2507 domain-containing protein [Pseudogracilibacillus sp.]
MGNQLISLSTLNEFDPKTVGQDVIRYISLPSLLGHEKDSLLYFTGRKLARKIKIETIDDIVYLFAKFHWGNLELVKEKKNQMVFHLMADEVVKRLQSSIETDFRLEAGFLAEAMQTLTERAAESTESVNERLFLVQFKVYFTS